MSIFAEKQEAFFVQCQRIPKKFLTKCPSRKCVRDGLCNKQTAHAYSFIASQKMQARSLTSASYTPALLLANELRYCLASDCRSTTLWMLLSRQIHAELPQTDCIGPGKPVGIDCQPPPGCTHVPAQSHWVLATWMRSRGAGKGEAPRVHLQTRSYSHAGAQCSSQAPAAASGPRGRPNRAGSSKAARRNTPMLASVSASSGIMLLHPANPSRHHHGHPVQLHVTRNTHRQGCSGLGSARRLPGLSASAFQTNHISA